MAMNDENLVSKMLMKGDALKEKYAGFDYNSLDP